MQDQQQTEALWRSRLRDSRLRLDFASNYVREIQRDFASGELPAPDGQYAYQKALRAESFALAEYRRVLGIYTDLVVRGKIPDAS